MRNVVLLLSCALVVSLACAAPVKIGSGVNLAGMEFGEGAIPGIYDTNYVLPTTNEVDYYVNLGLRNFRVPFLWERMQTSLDATLDTTYFNRYDSLIQYIIGKGATAIIDPHNYARYHGAIIGASGSGVTTANFVNFWRQLADKYKSHADLVIFGLMNEPHDMSSVSWFASAQAVITALRADGITNTILVPGNSWTGARVWTSTEEWISTDRPVISNAELAANLTDPLKNLVFEVHQYFDDNFSGGQPNCPTSNTAAGIFTAFENWLSTNDLYGYLGEFAGGNNGDCQTIVSATMQRLAANPRWIGSSWWAGGPWWGPYMYLFETANLQGQAPQMAWQLSNLLTYERYPGYNPASSTPSAPTTSTVPSSAPSVPVSGPSSTPLSATPSTSPAGGNNPVVINPSSVPIIGTPSPVGNVDSPTNHANSLFVSWTLFAFAIAFIAL